MNRTHYRRLIVAMAIEYEMKTQTITFKYKEFVNVTNATQCLLCRRVYVLVSNVKKEAK